MYSYAAISTRLAVPGRREVLQASWINPRLSFLLVEIESLATPLQDL